MSFPYFSISSSYTCIKSIIFPYVNVYKNNFCHEFDDLIAKKHHEFDDIF